MDWPGLAKKWIRLILGWSKEWPWYGICLALDWNLIGTGLAWDWRWLARTSHDWRRLIVIGNARVPQIHPPSRLGAIPYRGLVLWLTT